MGGFARRIARKKLRAAARSLIGRGDEPSHSEDIADAMALFGVSEAEARAALGPPPAPPELVLPADLQSAVRLFDAALGQWRTAGVTGVLIGLDYVALDVAARWLGVTPSPRLLGDIRIMEAEALSLLNAKPEGGRSS